MKDQLILEMARELEELEAHHPVIAITVTPAEALTLIAILQLVLRHRGVRASNRELPQRIKAALTEVLSTYPALARAIEMGEDPRFDK